MSVPPVVAPARTTMPSPTPSSTPPKTVASMMSPAGLSGGSRSMNTESSTIATNERTAKRQPTCRQPSRNSGSRISVPMILMETWRMATRRAFTLVPMQEMREVAQVPMFRPMMMGSAMP